VKIRHILRAKEFSDILRSGRRVRSKTVFLSVKRGSGERGLSVGIIISKKVAPKAVRRNYIRRLIYSYFRDYSDVREQDVEIIARVIRDVQSLKKKPLSKLIRGELGILIERAGI